MVLPVDWLMPDEELEMSSTAPVAVMPLTLLTWLTAIPLDEL